MQIIAFYRLFEASLYGIAKTAYISKMERWKNEKKV